jgi:hypothetical protein
MIKRCPACQASGCRSQKLRPLVPAYHDLTSNRLPRCHAVFAWLLLNFLKLQYVRFQRFVPFPSVSPTFDILSPLLCNMKATTVLSVFGLAITTRAQNVTRSIAPSATVNGTAIQNPTALALPIVLNVQDLWDMLVGPVTEAYYTTTVSPTPIPSSSLVPPPPIHYPSFPSGQQYPMVAKNESWSFPKDFW